MTTDDRIKTINEQIGKHPFLCRFKGEKIYSYPMFYRLRNYDRSIVIDIGYNESSSSYKMEVFVGGRWYEEYRYSKDINVSKLYNSIISQMKYKQQQFSKSIKKLEGWG